MVNKALVVAPLRVCYSVWPNEVQKWKDFKDIKVEVLHGPDKEKALARDADIYVINPEGLPWLLQAVIEKKTGRSGRTSHKIVFDRKRWEALGFDLLILDELTKFKNLNSIRSKLLLEVHKTFSRRWGLTGSPTANGLMGLFGQAYVLDEGRSLGRYITHFRSKYFMTVDKEGFIWVPQPGAEDQIYQQIAPLALRMAANDYLDMPAKIDNEIYIDLPDKARMAYDQLESNLLAAFDGKLITAKNAAVSSGKCRQIANGGIYLEPDLKFTGFKLPKTKREWVNLHTEKVDALVDLIEELQGSPLLVAYDFEHDLDRIREKLGQDVPYIGGGVTAKRSKELEIMWNAGKLPVLLGHPQSIGHGMNLQEVGHHVVWHSLTYDYELYDQFIRRVLRQGNKSKRVFVHHIIARDTIDEVMLAALRSKQKNQQAFFDALKQLANKRKKV